MSEEKLSFCSRCHKRFEEMGEVLEWGKFYPASQVKHLDGRKEFIPDTWEIRKALCKSCMAEVNSKKFDKENNKS